MEVKLPGLGAIIAIIVLILAIVLMVIGHLSLMIGLFVCALAVARLT